LARSAEGLIAGERNTFFVLDIQDISSFLEQNKSSIELKSRSGKKKKKKKKKNKRASLGKKRESCLGQCGVLNKNGLCRLFECLVTALKG
jgi:hypothetical protein